MILEISSLVFKIVGLDGNMVFLKGVDLRLYADSDVNDLVVAKESTNSDKEII